MREAGREAASASGERLRLQSGFAMAAGATAAKLHLSSAAAAGRRPSLLHLAAVAVLCSLSYLLGIWHHGGFSTSSEDVDRSLRFSRDRLVYRERNYPSSDAERLRCLVPAPRGYRNPFPWPASRDVAWFAKFRFPGGGTMFPRGADAYIDDIGRIIPLRDGSIRTALDTGCGVSPLRSQSQSAASPPRTPPLVPPPPRGRPRRHAASPPRTPPLVPPPPRGRDAVRLSAPPRRESAADAASGLCFARLPDREPRQAARPLRPCLCRRDEM